MAHLKNGDKIWDYLSADYEDYHILDMIPDRSLKHRHFEVKYCLRFSWQICLEVGVSSKTLESFNLRTRSHVSEHGNIQT
jgi:hypothetical protein